MYHADVWSCAERILCVRLDALGDVLLTVPALRALKDSHSGRRLTLLTAPAGAAVASLIPEIDDVIVYDAPWMRASPARHDSRVEYLLADRLRHEDFHGAIVFTAHSQNPLPAALLCYLADIPLRLAHCRENPYHLLTHWVHDPEARETPVHEVRRQLNLVASVGCKTSNEKLGLAVPEGARRHIKRLLAQQEINLQRPWVVIHPGAGVAARRYPPEGYAKAARLLALEKAYQVVFAGLAGDRELVEGIQDMMGVPSHALVGTLSFSEFTALLAAAPVLVANNTGPVHVAAAVGTPVVDIYALTQPQHTPWGVPHRILSHDVPCKYCQRNAGPEEYPNFLRLIPPEAIVRATCELYEETRTPTRMPAPTVARAPLDLHSIAGSQGRSICRDPQHQVHAYRGQE
jgi:lipopolysaccharide heptosyltransferase II